MELFWVKIMLKDGKIFILNNINGYANSKMKNNKTVWITGGGTGIGTVTYGMSLIHI